MNAKMNASNHSRSTDFVGRSWLVLPAFLGETDAGSWEESVFSKYVYQLIMGTKSYNNVSRLS